MVFIQQHDWHKTSCFPMNEVDFVYVVWVSTAYMWQWMDCLLWQWSLMWLCTYMELEKFVGGKTSKWHRATTNVADISPDISHSPQLCPLAMSRPQPPLCPPIHDSYANNDRVLCALSVTTRQPWDTLWGARDPVESTGTPAGGWP